MSLTSETFGSRYPMSLMKTPRAVNKFFKLETGATPVLRFKPSHKVVSNCAVPLSAAQICLGVRAGSPEAVPKIAQTRGGKLLHRVML